MSTSQLRSRSPRPAPRSRRRPARRLAGLVAVTSLLVVALDVTGAAQSQARNCDIGASACRGMTAPVDRGTIRYP